jgi:hypothetical protein
VVKEKDTKETGKNLDWDGIKYSRAGLIRYIEENEKEKELEKRVIDKWEQIESEISSQGRKERWKRKK